MTSIERWSIVPRTMLMPFRSARNLFPSWRKNSELSACKANVTAIIVQSVAMVFWRSIGKARGRLSPLPFQGRGKGEGSLRAYPMSKTPHLNPLPLQKRGEASMNALGRSLFCGSLHDLHDEALLLTCS